MATNNALQAGSFTKTKRKARVERILAKREPQVHEFAKKVLTMKGVKCSASIQDLLLDLSMLAKPNSVNLTRTNEIFPFEDANSLEFLTMKNNCSLFAIGSHSKKRPNNIILGRTFDGHIYDMFEFGVENLVSIQECMAANKCSHKAIGSKPCIIFNGDQWGNDSSFTKLQLFFLDFFRGVKVDQIALKGLDHVISISIMESRIYLRVYSINYKRSGSKIPITELAEIGPRCDLVVRRYNHPSVEMQKTACRKPKIDKPRKVKNVKDGVLGEKLGRIHIKKQDLDNMGTRQVSALRLKRKNSAATDGAGGTGSGSAILEGGSEQAMKKKSRRT